MFFGLIDISALNAPIRLRDQVGHCQWYFRWWQIFMQLSGGSKRHILEILVSPGVEEAVIAPLLAVLHQQSVQFLDNFLRDVPGMISLEYRRQDELMINHV